MKQVLEVGTKVVIYCAGYNSFHAFGIVESHTNSGAPRIQFVASKDKAMDGSELPSDRWLLDHQYIVQPQWDVKIVEPRVCRWSKVNDCWLVRHYDYSGPTAVEIYHPEEIYSEYYCEY